MDPNGWLLADFHKPWEAGSKCSDADPCLKPDENNLWKERVTFVKGVPTESEVLEKVRGLLKGWNAKTVMVSEDSIHQYPVVMDNLRAYWEFVSIGSYLLVQVLPGGEHAGRCMPDKSGSACQLKCWAQWCMSRLVVWKRAFLQSVCTCREAGLLACLPIVQDTKLTRYLKAPRCAGHASPAAVDSCWSIHKTGPGDAARKFLSENKRFEADTSQEFLLYSQHAGGFLKRVR